MLRQRDYEFPVRKGLSKQLVALEAIWKPGRLLLRGVCELAVFFGFRHRSRLEWSFMAAVPSGSASSASLRSKSLITRRSPVVKITRALAPGTRRNLI